MATLVLAVSVEICLSKAKLCCFYFFTINLNIWCENGSLSPVFFLPHCNLLRPLPYLSIMAIVMVTVTCWCCLNMLCHTAVFAVARCKVDGWPALLDFQTLKGSGSGLTADLLGKLWLVFKKKDVHTHTHTHMHTYWHTSFFSEGTTVCLFILSSHPLIPSDTLHS